MPSPSLFSLSLLLFSSVHPSISPIISQNIQLDTNPQGTVKLILSDDFAEEPSSPVSDNLPYCGGNITCRYLDPWDLNWPIGTWVHIMRYNRCTYSLVNHPYFLGGGAYISCAHACHEGKIAHPYYYADQPWSNLGKCTGSIHYYVYSINY